VTATPQRPISRAWQSEVDLTAAEQKRYSLVRALQASMSGNWADAGLERECSETLAKQLRREPGQGGFFVPSNLSMRAAYNTGAVGTGGAIVATNLLSGSFIEALTAKLVLMDAGCTTLTGLVGNCDIPRRSTRAQAYWVPEGGAIGESEGTFDKITLRARQVGALSTMSRLMLQQSTPDIEMLVRLDLATILALAIDNAGLFGTGTNGQPTGVFNTSGVTSLSLGTNGAALTNLDPLVQMRGRVASSNVDARNGVYIMNEPTRAALMQTKNSYNEYYFAVEGSAPGTAENVFGNRVLYTNTLPSTLTKGTSTGKCSAAIFGDFSNLVLGMWGATEILTNPYGSGFNAGNVDVRAFQTVDFAVRHPEAFVCVSDILA